MSEVGEAGKAVPLITAPGAYPNIAAEDYHGREICPAPSISSTGLKKLAGSKAGQSKGCSPRHYWHESALNPNREPQVERSHFRVGRAAHDVLLLSERWPDFYHVTPKGFSRAKSTAMAGEIAEADAALDAGMTVLSQAEAETVSAMAASLQSNPLASAVLTNGEPEVTLAWQNAETGVWVRARPDFLPAARTIIPDLKTAADASYEGFQRAIKANGYVQSAALYLDGIKAVFGDAPAHWLHVVIEKEPPYVVALWELPAADIERGRWLNRRAINLFAECLNADRWPGYADEPEQCGLPGWARKMIDEGTSFDGVTHHQKDWM